MDFMKLLRKMFFEQKIEAEVSGKIEEEIDSIRFDSSFQIKQLDYLFLVFLEYCFSTISTFEISNHYLSAGLTDAPFEQ